MKMKEAIWILFALVSCFVLTEARKRSKKNHRSAPCSRGCVRCDEINGCLQCRRSFLFITTNEGREYGICKHDCPAGYFGQRGRPTNKCIKCSNPNCKACFTDDYCTSCHENFFLHAATCAAQCPDGLIANPYTGKCEDKVDCVVGPWSSWSRCARRKPSRSCKHGRKKRTRVIVQEPTENGRACPRLKETKKCKTPPEKCILVNKWLQRFHKFKKRTRDKKRKKERKGKGKNRNNEIQDNRTVSRSIEHGRNTTLTLGHAER